MIVVIGGGITGLAIGRALAHREDDFLLLEASDRPGGVIRSGRVDGRVLDWGPQRTRLTAGVRDAVRELGLQDELLTAPSGLDLFVYRDGGLHVVPFTPHGFLKSGIVSGRAKLRLLMEPFTGGLREGERVSRYFERKLGREVYETIVAPLYGGLYASDPADMEVDLSLAHVLREFGIGRSLLVPLLRKGGRIAPPPAVSFRDGMQTLPDALARILGDRVRLNAPVRSLARSGSAWRVEAGTPDETLRLDARKVVLAVPAPTAARLLGQVAPAAAAVIGALRYNPLGVVHLEAETDLRGLGFQVSFSERERALRGVTFNDSLFGRDGVYTAYLGGALRPDVAHWAPGLLGERAVTEFRETTGFDARVLATEQERVPAWDVTWGGLHEVALPDGLMVAGNWWSRPGLPGRLAEGERVARALASERPVSGRAPARDRAR